MAIARQIIETAIGLSILLTCGLKGKYGFVFLGFALPLLWVIGAVKPAKPRSWWARRYYGDVGMSESEQRFVLSRRQRPPAPS